jgi:adenine-specific DNA-methyltransferase
MGNINGREILRSIIENFSTEKFIHFFRNKNTSFKPLQVAISNYNDGDFTSGEKIGEINFQDNNLIVCSFQVLKELTERSGKKKQYELGKRILKDTNQDAGIFIFYDQNGNFRFSLIYTEYSGTRRKFSLFKRFTYFVSKEKTNKTFLQQIGQGDFSSLEKIKEAFSVEPVTRQFYQEIANWYFWAIKNVRFPKGAEELPNGRNIAVIRLITRIIFIWFMKVRNLIPDELFDEKSLKNILKNFDPYSKNSSSFYLAILQNLFFATLNTKQEERRFRSKERGHKGYNTDFGNHNVYRYENLFINSEEAIKKYFLPIPFLNGGLFECLDYKSKNKEERKYVDGFTDTKENQPFFPNYLFFAEMDYADLSEDYNDPKYKKTEVKGLIKILQQYNFTIDENEPDDVEVALDPELLGNVFENLLASYNPETATTARKATGSYYTPREIVDYMVDESLKEYFKTNIPDIDEENLNKLFSKEDYQNPFDENTTSKLINLIDSLRIVDPAVGSGAFPMRILNRLVFLLHKLDPDNSKWEATQIEGLKKSVKDPVLQKELIEQIKKRFKEKNPDYGRKLYLIEKCIYGVDIQQIAVEIAKLRFFISLLVDETIDSNEENYGIEPLPNLDFKIMQGNSLISTFYNIDFKQNSTPTGELPLDFEPRYKQLISEFEWLKSQYQSEHDVSKKQDLRKKIDEKIIEIFEEKLKQKFSELRRIEENANKIPQEEQREKYIKEEKKKLSKKLGFDIDKAKEELIAYTDGRKDKNFFLWDIYFAEVFTEKNGFDIVIGNPPYGANYPPDLKKYFFENYSTAKTIKGEQKGSLDTYTLFIEKGFNLLKPNGFLIFIVPISITSSESVEGLHNLLERNCRIIKISSYAVRPQPIFQNSVVNTSIISFIKTLTPAEKILCTKMYRKSKDISISDILNNLEFIDVKEFKLKGRYPKISYQIEKDILQKIFDKNNNIPIGNLIRKNGKEIYYRFAGGRYFKVITPYSTKSSTEKVLKFDKDIANVIGAILSSNLFFWFYQIYSDNFSLKLYDISIFCIPYKKLLENPDLIKKIEKVYNEYLNDIEKNAIVKKATRYKKIKKFKEYRIKKSKHIIDKIDDLICPLYGMTEQEIDFIKNYEIKFRLSDEISNDENE